jgi:hypothetical protein
MMNQSVERFYQRGFDAVPVISACNGVVTQRNAALFLGRQPFLGDEADIDAKIVETYESIGEVHSADQNYAFEIATVNQDATGGDIVIASTYSSSLTTNAGNIYELAIKAVTDPEHRYTYVALPGNGLSTSLTKKERQHVAQHGSLLKHEHGATAPLPVVKALGTIMMQRSIEPLHLSSDSAGALLTTALGTVTPRGSVRSVFQNVRAGFTDLSPFRLAKGVLVDDKKFASIAERTSPDSFKVTNEVVKRTKTLKPAGLAFGGRSIVERLSMYSAYADGLSIGPARGKDPLVEDTAALLLNNPDARLRFVTEDNDVLMSDPRIIRRVVNVLRDLSAAGGNIVDAVMVTDGFHSAHTYYPQYIDAMRQDLL